MRRVRAALRAISSKEMMLMDVNARVRSTKRMMNVDEAKSFTSSRVNDYALGCLPSILSREAAAAAEGEKRRGENQGK